MSQVRVVDGTGVDSASVDVATGALSVTVAGLRTADGASGLSSSATVRVGGTWGAPSPPRLLRGVAVDGGRNVGLDAGDSLVLQFDQATNAPPLPDTLAVLRLLTFTPALAVPGNASAVACVGAWSNGSTVLTVTFVGFAQGPGARGWAAFNVGLLRVRVNPDGGLRSANGESAATATNVTVGEGTWGDAPVVVVVEKSSIAIQVCALMCLAPCVMCHCGSHVACACVMCHACASVCVICMCM